MPGWLSVPPTPASARVPPLLPLEKGAPTVHNPSQLAGSFPYSLRGGVLCTSLGLDHSAQEPRDAAAGAAAGGPTVRPRGIGDRALFWASLCSEQEPESSRKRASLRQPHQPLLKTGSLLSIMVECKGDLVFRAQCFRGIAGLKIKHHLCRDLARGPVPGWGRRCCPGPKESSFHRVRVAGAVLSPGWPSSNTCPLT